MFVMVSEKRVMKKIIFFDGDGTLWYPKETKHKRNPVWIYKDKTIKYYNDFNKDLDDILSVISGYKKLIAKLDATKKFRSFLTYIDPLGKEDIFVNSVLIVTDNKVTTDQEGSDEKDFVEFRYDFRLQKQLVINICIEIEC